MTSIGAAVLLVLVLPGCLAQDGTRGTDSNSGFCSRDSCTASNDVTGFVGENVILPCSFKNPQTIDFKWKDGNNKIVLDIFDGAEKDSQDPRYKGRVSSFQQEYNNGNFSINMKGLQQSDGGIYKCMDVSEAVVMEVNLQISEIGGAAGTNVLHVALHIVLALLLTFQI